MARRKGYRGGAGGKGTGQPAHFQCSACRRRKPWPPERDPEAWRKGLLLRVTLTGRAKAIGDGKASGRSTNTRLEYKCDDCGHVGWSRHYMLLYKAWEEGIETPGEENGHRRQEWKANRGKR
jgi:hypothetical protein